MRSIWKGAISFGLVSVPVKVYSATESHDVSLHQVHAKDGGRIRYQRRCEICGKIVDYGDIDKAYDDGQNTVVLTEEDLDSLPAERNHEIEVVEFVPADQVDVLRLDRSYYLEPEEKALKQYTLLRRALEDSDRTAIVRFALRQKTRLAALRVRGDVLLLQTLLWDDEVRKPAFDILDTTPRITPKERDMAAQLVDSLAADFDSSAFTDDYQDQLRQLVEAKLKDGASLDTEATFGEQDSGEDAEVVDLMEALRRSIDSKKSAASTTTAAVKKASAKKPAARKKAAKKPSRKAAS
ncbi:Ku protein [Aeromicrobium sp.]|uniref:non-homologous end joining protein Ku n=1 Tax=Aeromicrobium sp. TaxID=1871063 RepID=UPI0019B7467A|nr:Ku protein [Aeromicrobium sp.]MBC7632141.1 Ku protein [Aeromicrobium sp.]